jgi:hypothetical protein
MRTMQIKPPTKRSLKQNLLVAAIIDVDLEKERRKRNEKISHFKGKRI